MKEMPLNTSEQMLFALLRSSLHEKEAETVFFLNASEEEWMQCYRLAVAQGVMALAWDGVLRLPKELHPSRKLKLMWAMAVERYEARYLKFCKTVDELSTFFAGHGIEMVQLKGVGFSTLYPVPSHREGGDIDIYTCSADKNRMDDCQANILSDKLMQQQGVEIEHFSYKHSNFHYNGVPVENHKIFLNVKDIKEAVLANEILNRELKPRTVELIAGKVLVPSPTFNALFIAFHAMQHYGSGISLHHLCDWAIILKHFGLIIPEEMKDFRFYQGIKALTHLCNDHLGTAVLVDGGKELANEMLQEILNPLNAMVVPENSKMGVILYKIRCLLHTYKLKSHVFDVSLSRRIWTSVVRNVRNPEMIFRRNRK